MLYSKTASLLPQFIKTVESVGANLTQKVYLFLTYLQVESVHACTVIMITVTVESTAGEYRTDLLKER